MKIILIFILAFVLLSPARAGDSHMVTDSTIKAFLEIYPKYVDILEKYGQGFESSRPEQAAYEYVRELEGLLENFNISLEDFTVLVQKISAGFAGMEMEKSGAGLMFGQAIRQMQSLLTVDEKRVIENYFNHIKEVLIER